MTSDRERGIATRLVRPLFAVAAVSLAALLDQSGILNDCAGYGKPVVASDTSYFRSLEREWGCLRTCDFEDPAEAEAVIRELLNDPEKRARLSERIQEYAEAHSFAEVAKRHERIYRIVSNHEAETSRGSIGGERVDA